MVRNVVFFATYLLFQQGSPVQKSLIRIWRQAGENCILNLFANCIVVSFSWKSRRGYIASLHENLADFLRRGYITCSNWKAWRLLPPSNEVCKGYVFTGVCLSTEEGGVCFNSCWDIHPLGRHPPGQTPPGQTPPWADTPFPRADPPPAQCILGYGQQAGGTHPTGMHSCSESKIAASSPLSLISQKKKTVRKETKSRILPAPSSYCRGNLIVRSAKKNLYNGLWTKFCMTPFHSIE